MYVWLYMIGFTCTYIISDAGEENIDPTEQAYQKRHQKYTNLIEGEKERRHAMVR